MPNLAQLKQRLEKLPEFHRERGLKNHFREYGQKVTNYLEGLEQAHKCLKAIEVLEENPTFKRNVLREIKETIKDAKNIKEKISEEAKSVGDRATENAIGRINGSQRDANILCRDRWKGFIEKRENKWSKIAEVVEKLPKKTGGKEFKDSFDKFTRWKANIPQTEKEIKEIQQLKDALGDGITKLGLEGEFGKFLEATAVDGASIEDLKKPKIIEKLDEYDLWKSFRVHL